jgi:hypothetical protein
MNHESSPHKAWETLNTAQAYDSDIALLRKLGLKTFKGSTWQPMDLGTAKLEDGSWVKVSVTCAPAQFWSFEVFCAEAKQVTKFSTGSGSFRQYWPLAEAIAQGRIAVDSLDLEPRIQEETLSGLPIKQAQAIEPTLEQIAKQELGVETLATRNSDQLDFYDLNVASVKAALLKAYEAGARQGGGGQKM